MKKNYYELQVYVPGLNGYRTIFSYYGTRSNCTRKFGSFVSSYPGRFPSLMFSVNTYHSIESMLSGESPVRVSVFNSFDR